MQVCEMGAPEPCVSSPSFEVVVVVVIIGERRNEKTEMPTFQSLARSMFILYGRRLL